jgi:cobalt-zinc-cadmium efflux system outer membrane protein
MNIRSITALAVVAVLFASSAAAQSPPSRPTSAALFVDPEHGVSLEQAIAQALAQEPSIRAVRSTLDVARGMRQQAGLRKNPALTIEVRAEPGGTDDQTMISAEWPLDLFRRQGRIDVAERELATAELSVADRERLLAADVRARFGDVLVAARELTVIEELAATARRQHDLLRSRVEQGASPPLERDLLDVELRRLDADRLIQLGRAEHAMFDLQRILGIPPGGALRVRETLEDIVNREAAPSTTSSTDAAKQRADVREAEARVALADAKVARAQRDGRFDLSLFGGYTRMDAGFPQFGLSRAGTPERVRGLFHYVSGGAMVTMPLFNRNQGEVAAARAERAGATAVHDAARLSAETEIATARVLDRRAHEAVQLYGRTARTLARQNLNVIEQSYELGRTTIFEVLAEQKRYLDLERAYTETLRAAFEARTALTRAAGERP